MISVIIIGYFVAPSRVSLDSVGLPPACSRSLLLQILGLATRMFKVWLPANYRFCFPPFHGLVPRRLHGVAPACSRSLLLQILGLATHHFTDWFRADFTEWLRHVQGLCSCKFWGLLPTISRIGSAPTSRSGSDRLSGSAPVMHNFGTCSLSFLGLCP